VPASPRIHRQCLYAIIFDQTAPPVATKKNDNVALSFVFVFICGMASLVDQRSSTDLPDIIDVVLEMGRASPGGSRTKSQSRSHPPLPLPVRRQSAPASTSRRAGRSRARGYVEAASSSNTRRAYASDWKHFASWCRRQGRRNVSAGSTVVGALHHRPRLRQVPQARRPERKNPSRRSSGASPLAPGTMHSAASRSIARTAISPQ
jgi:hypothetical protein